MKSDCLNDLLSAPWKVAVVFTSVRLKIFSIISNRALTVEDIASKCGADTTLLKPLLDACVSMGLLETVNDTYINTHFSRIHLVEREPQYVGDLIELQYDEFIAWYNYYDVVTGGKKPERTEQEKYKTFIKGMNNLGMLGEADAVRDRVDLSGCKEMVDAGGGSGLYSIILCRAYPELQSTIWDRRETLEVTKALIAPYKEKERIALIEGDITRDPLGEDIDAVLLSDVIYDTQEGKAVIKNAWDCLRPEGTLIIRGYYSDPGKTRPLFGALFVLNLVTFDPNRTVLTIDGLTRLVTENGFTIEIKAPLTERSFILTAKK